MISWFPLDLGLFTAILGSLCVFLLALSERKRDRKEKMLLSIILFCVLAGAWSSTKGSQKIVSTITGGDSFAYLVPVGPFERPDFPRFAITHQGDYPLYELSVEILDLDKVPKGFSYSEREAATTDLHIGTLIPKSASIQGNLPLGLGDKRRFNIFFRARNGGFTQALRFVRVENRWIYATRVTEERTGDVLYEQLDPAFPRNSAGGVEW